MLRGAPPPASAHPARTEREAERRGDRLDRNGCARVLQAADPGLSLAPGDASASTDGRVEVQSSSHGSFAALLTARERAALTRFCSSAARFSSIKSSIGASVKSSVVVFASFSSS